MVNGRNPGRKRDTGRDPGGFVALPWSVLDSAAYMGLSPTAKALLMEVARQYHRDDNGRMLLSRVHLAARGWFSAGAIQKAKAQLIAAGLIFETVKGCRPNKASWYAVTWRMLDKLRGYDMDTERAFQRSAYRKTPPREKRPPPAAPANAKRKKNASLIPAAGTESAPIVPAHGTESPAAVPPHGAIRPTFDPFSVPPHGHPLEVPSQVCELGRGTIAKPAICQHAGCRTITLKREFCAKHRPMGRADIAVVRDADVIDRHGGTVH